MGCRADHAFFWYLSLWTQNLPDELTCGEAVPPPLHDQATSHLPWHPPIQALRVYFFRTIQTMSPKFHSASYQNFGFAPYFSTSRHSVHSFVILTAHCSTIHLELIPKFSAPKCTLFKCYETSFEFWIPQLWIQIKLEIKLTFRVLARLKIGILVS